MARIRNIQNVPITDLVNYTNNAKVHPADQIEKIAKSIKEVGFISPLLIDADYNVIAGHGRLKAAEKLKMKTVPCVFIEGLSEVQRRAYILMDNRLAELGSWDMDLVYTELEDLDADDFDIDLTGFELNTETDDWFNTRERNDNSGLKDENEEYKEFVDKFVAKRTTDDCYTPDNVYTAVSDWVSYTYGIQQSQFVRPFVPGGDYQGYKYKKDAVVVDNPPFSILAEITQYYTDHNIKFFLFAPALTLFSSSATKNCTCIAVGNSITYENGANINTSYITNLENSDIVARSAPDLYEAVQIADKENLSNIKQHVPTYEYPDNVLTSTMVSRLSKYGVRYELRRGQSTSVSALDCQKESGKAIFGKGFLLSEKAAAEKAAAEKSDTVKWPLSDRERNLIHELSKND